MAHAFEDQRISQNNDSSDQTLLISALMIHRRQHKCYIENERNWFPCHEISIVSSIREDNMHDNLTRRKTWVTMKCNEPTEKQIILSYVKELSYFNNDNAGLLTLNGEGKI